MEMKKFKVLVLLIVLGFISTLVGGVGDVFGNPGGVAVDFEGASDSENYIASKTNLVVSGGQVKLAEDCSIYECGESDGAGGCQPKAAGEQGLPACKRCNGSSLDAVNIADNTQDTEGSNLCNQACKKCSGGSCVNQSSSEDLFGQCDVVECYTGNCNGSGACGYFTNGQHGCPAGYECNDAGVCVGPPLPSNYCTTHNGVYESEGQKVLCADGYMWSNTLAGGYEWGYSGSQVGDCPVPCIDPNYKACYACYTLNYAGFDDWVLPNRTTLANLWDGSSGYTNCGTNCTTWDLRCCASGATYPEYYWASQEYSASSARRVHFTDGWSESGASKALRFSIRCVRQ